MSASSPSLMLAIADEWNLNWSMPKARETQSQVRSVQGQRPAWGKDRGRTFQGLEFSLNFLITSKGLVAYLTMEHLFLPGAREHYGQRPWKPLNTGPHNGCLHPSWYHSGPTSAFTFFSQTIWNPSGSHYENQAWSGHQQAGR